MPFKAYLEAIDLEISNTKYGEEPVELYEPLDYIMSLGGKRIRPTLTLLAANLWLYNWQKALKPALAIEVFHNFSLLHDDIMDKAPLRRGQATVHEKWNANTAILSGDVMLIAVYELLTTIEDRHFKKIIKRFNKTAAEVCEGQQLDMLFATKESVTKAEYLNMIKLKTSVLLGFALELGATVADADDESIELLNKIGVNLGIGFQLQDDILDVYGNPEKFGKQVGGDIIQNRKTWLMLDALEKIEGRTEQKELLKLFKKKNINPEDKVSAVTEIYNILKVKESSEKEMNRYFRAAFSDIERLKVSTDKKKMLKQYADSILNREN